MSKPPEENAGGYLRGLAAALGGSRAGIRAIGEARPLAFASEVAVAGQRVWPRPLYLGLWGLSVLAVGADITNKVCDAPPEKRRHVGIYELAFHIPASLVVPAGIIHVVVRASERSLAQSAYAARLPPRLKAVLPIAVAIAAIVPVVPAVDSAFEAMLRPTLGKALGLELESQSH